MNEQPRGNRWLRLAAVAAIVAGLAVAAVALRQPVDEGDEHALYPHDKIGLWQKASPGTKQATAEVLIAELERSGKFGPQTVSLWRDAAGRRALAAELTAALDAATDSNRKEYVSPGDSLLLTAEAIVAKKGWDK